MLNGAVPIGFGKSFTESDLDVAFAVDSQEVGMGAD